MDEPNNLMNSLLPKNESYYLIINELKGMFQSTFAKKEFFANIKKKKFYLSVMLFYLVVYFFMCCTLLIINFQGQENIEQFFCLPFHMMDLWGSFGFALIEAFILTMSDIVKIGSLRYLMVCCNIGGTLVAAMLFSLNNVYWEVTAHWIEYCVQILLTISDLFFIFHQFKKCDSILYKYRYHEMILIILMTLLSILKLFIYGDLISLGVVAEEGAHYLEFSGEMVNASFAYIFTLMMYREYDVYINNIFIPIDEENKLN